MLCHWAIEACCVLGLTICKRNQIYHITPVSRTICRISYIKIKIFFLPSQTFLVGKQNVQGLTKTWAWPGFEPGTSRTRSANHTPRPSSHLYYIQCHTKSYKSHNFIVRLKMRTGKIFNLLILKKGLFMHKISWLSHLSSSCGRVVKALDLKSNGLCPRRFEPCQLRDFFSSTIRTRMSKCLCLLWGLNPRPPVYETGALPLS